MLDYAGTFAALTAPDQPNDGSAARPVGVPIGDAPPPPATPIPPALLNPAQNVPVPGGATSAQPPQPVNPDHVQHVQAAAGNVLAKTGNIDLAGRILDLAKPGTGTGSQEPGASSNPQSGKPSLLQTLAQPPDIVNGSAGGIGARADGMDAPDLTVRTAALKAAQGVALTGQEWRRLANREQLEGQPGSGVPQGAAANLSPQSVFSTLAGTRLDGQRGANDATTVALQQARDQQDLVLGAQRIQDGAATAAQRTATTTIDQQRAASEADQQAKYTAAVRAGAKTRQDLATAGVTDPRLLDSYPLDRAAAGGFGTAEQARASIPAGATGEVRQETNGRWTANFKTGEEKVTYPRDITVGNRKLTEVSPGKFADAATGRPVTWTNDVPKPLSFDAFLASPSLTNQYKGDYAAYYLDAVKQNARIQAGMDSELQKSAPAAAFKTADDVKAAVQAGKLDRAAAIKVLQSQFGMK